MIKDKVIIITGASSGEATALLLAENKAKVVLGARGEEKLKSLYQKIKETGGDAVYASVDVKKRADVAQLIQLTIDTYGKIDVLVNNAGIMPVSPFEELKVRRVPTFKICS